MPTFAILGFPVEHSKSPQLHQAVFDAFGLEGWKYEYFECPPEELSEAVRKLKKGDYNGFSVTIPHKKEILKHANQLSMQAARLSAANTLIRREDGSIFAENTDYLGFKAALEDYDFPIMANGSWQSGAKNALVLGSGGAAQAVIAALKDLDFKVTVASRKPKQGQTSYEDLNPAHDWQVIVNTTPLGMAHLEFEEQSPLTDEAWFQPNRTFVDVIYTPRITPFLKKAQAAGAPTITGEAMFLWQAVEQSKLFMRKDDEGSMAKIVEVMEGVLSQ